MRRCLWIPTALLEKGYEIISFWWLSSQVQFSHYRIRGHNKMTSNNRKHFKNMMKILYFCLFKVLIWGYNNFPSQSKHKYLCALLLPLSFVYVNIEIALKLEYSMNKHMNACIQWYSIKILRHAAPTCVVEWHGMASQGRNSGWIKVKEQVSSSFAFFMLCVAQSLEDGFIFLRLIL